MDYNRTLTLLRVNGLSPESSHEEIRSFLTRANYSEADIQEFLNASANSPAQAAAPAQVSAPDAPISVAPEAFAAPAQPVATPAPAATATPAPSGTGRTITMLIAAIVILIALGVGGYTAFAMYGMKPTDGVLMGIKTSADQKKFHVDLDFHNTSTARNEQFQITVAADVDATDENALKIAATPKVDSSVVSGTADVILIGKTAYAKIGEISFLGLPMSTTSATWYKIDESDVQSSGFVHSPTASQALSLTDKEETQKRAQSFFESGALVSTGAPTISFDDGAPILTYTFNVDGDKLSDWETSEGLRATSTVSSLTKVTYGPVTITKNLLTGRIRNVHGTLSSTLAFLSIKKTTNYEYQVTYSAKPSISIEAPANAKPISEFGSSALRATSALGGTTSSDVALARAKGQDAAIKSSLATIMTEAELYYDSHRNTYGTLSPSATCTTAATSNSIFSDPTVRSSLTRVPTAKSCHISADGQRYAISAQLVTDPKQWFCVDSTGQSRTTTGNTITVAGDVSCQ